MNQRDLLRQAFEQELAFMRPSSDLRARAVAYAVSSRRLRHPGRNLVLAAATVIAAALVVALLASRALVPSSSVPAGVGEQTTAQYVALVNDGDQLLQKAMGPPVCQGTDFTSPACHERIQNQLTATRQFQARMERAHPPARLAAMHARLREDLARLESLHQRVLNYVDAQDYAAARNPENAQELSAASDAYNSDLNAILSTPR